MSSYAGPYYSPEGFGLTLFGEANFDCYYGYSLVAVWRDRDGRFLWGHDSGNSDLVPFEDRAVSDLHPLTSLTALDDATRWYRGQEADREYAELMFLGLLERLREAGVSA